VRRALTAAEIVADMSVPVDSKPWAEIAVPDAPGSTPMCAPGHPGADRHVGRNRTPRDRAWSHLDHRLTCSRALKTNATRAFALAGTTTLAVATAPARNQRASGDSR
jgi:hypothetical protein